MGTTYQTIYEHAQSNLTDWQLDAVYETDVSAYEAILKQYLLRAIVNFEHCVTDIESRDDTAQTFDNDLTLLEQIILADLLALAWLEHSIQDANQMNLHVRDSEFNISSEAANLKAKLDLRGQLESRVKQMKINYSLNKVVNWSDWSNGIYNTNASS